MAISKRLRFEVLRRDKFRCYYCGTRGNESGEGLTIDHVVPVALGGTDDPENLVAACGDCNSGKTSTGADSALIAEVDRSVAVTRAAREIALTALKADLEAESEYRELVWSAWGRYAPSYLNGAGLDEYIDTWFKEGVPLELVEKSFRISFSNRDVAGRSKISYTGGVIRNLMGDIESRTQSLVAGENALYNEGMQAGYSKGLDVGMKLGWDNHADQARIDDLLTQHIDQMEPVYESNPFTDQPMFVGMVKRGT